MGGIGDGADGTDAPLEALFPGSEDWAAGRALPHANFSLLHGPSLASYGGSLYAVGGGPDQKTFEVYNGVAWSSGPSLNRERSQPGVASTWGFLYAFGGYDGAGDAVGSTEVFNGAAWSMGPSLSIPRTDFGFALYGGSIYAIGGREGSPDRNFTASVEVFNGGWWESGPSLPGVRAFHAAAVHDGLLYVVGGAEGSGPLLKSVLLFDGTSWNAGAQLPTGRAYHGVASYEGRLYAVGGQDDSGAAIASVDVFNGEVWSSGPDLGIERSQLGVAVWSPSPTRVDYQPLLLRTSGVCRDGAGNPYDKKLMGESLSLEGCTSHCSTANRERHYRNCHPHCDPLCLGLEFRPSDGSCWLMAEAGMVSELQQGSVVWEGGSGSGPVTRSESNSSSEYDCYAHVAPPCYEHCGDILGASPNAQDGSYEICLPGGERALVLCIMSEGGITIFAHAIDVPGGLSPPSINSPDYSTWDAWAEHAWREAGSYYLSLHTFAALSADASYLTMVNVDDVGGVSVPCVFFEPRYDSEANSFTYSFHQGCAAQTYGWLNHPPHFSGPGQNNSACDPFVDYINNYHNFAGCASDSGLFAWSNSGYASGDPKKYPQLIGYYNTSAYQTLLGLMVPRSDSDLGSAVQSPPDCFDRSATWLPNVESGVWRLVRHAPSGTANDSSWHPANDNLAGTAFYGDFECAVNSTSTFSLPWSTEPFDEYLFATADMQHWLIASRSEVNSGQYYSNSRQDILMSSEKAASHRSKWYHREDASQDPLISTANHRQSFFNGKLVYAEDSLGPANAEGYNTALIDHGGANVFIRTRTPWDVASQAAIASAATPLSGRTKWFGDPSSPTSFTDPISYQTWDDGHAYCASAERALCSYDQVCPDGAGVAPGGWPLYGEQWVPFDDGDGVTNRWVTVGTSGWAPCTSHEHVFGGFYGNASANNPVRLCTNPWNQPLVRRNQPLVRGNQALVR